MTDAISADGLSVVVPLCPLKLCSEIFPDSRTTPTHVMDELIARHLLKDHREFVATVGRLAEDGDLL